MILLCVMLIGMGVARGLGMLGWEYFNDWQAATRVGMAGMFVFTGIAHFNRFRADLVRMVPPKLPNPSAWVTFTGIAEFAGAIGLLIPPLAHFAAYGLILLLVAVFPANLYAARAQHTIAGRPHPPLAIRLPLQLLWIGLLGWAVS